MSEAVRVKFGYFVNQGVGDRAPGAVVREVLDEARAAEAAGFDGIFVSDHHGLTFSYLPTPVSLMHLLASVTQQADIGSAVLLLPLMQPTRVAEELAVLDHFSGGRVIAGLGGGYIQDDFNAFGVDRRRSGRMLEEGIEVMRRLWSGERVDHHGETYDVTSFTLFPPPVQRGGPPIWIGGRSLHGVRRAARLADAWLLDATPTLEMFRTWHAAYLKEATAAGRSPRTAILRDGWVRMGGAADVQYEDAAVAAHRRKLAAGVYAIDPVLRSVVPADAGFDAFAPDRWLTGSPEEVVAQVGRWNAELGIEYFLIRFRNGGLPPHEVTLEQIRAFGETVIAAHRHRTSFSA